MKLEEKCDDTSSHESHEGKHLAEEWFTKISLQWGNAYN